LADWLLSQGRSSVTTAEAADLLGVPSGQVRQRLHAPTRRGQWVSPARGLWLPVPPEYRTWGAPPGIEIVDRLLGYLGVDYYVGWLAAAELHGAAHEAPQVFQVATGRHVRDRAVGRTRFQFLTRADLGPLPVVQWPTRAGVARVATRELTLLDLAADLAVGGGLHNVATVTAELAEEGIDVEALARVARLFPAAAGRRVGYLLDAGAGLPGLDGLAAAVARPETAPSYLDPTAPAVGPLERRWRVCVNRTPEPEV
jgi:predicted transcriptional regulator of viral defense system